MTKDSPLTVAGAAAALGKFPRTAFPFDPQNREPSAIMVEVCRDRSQSRPGVPALLTGRVRHFCRMTSVAWPVMAPADIAARRRLGMLAGLVVLVVLLVLVSLGVGPVRLSPVSVIDALFGGGSDVQQVIVREIGLPRAILGLAIGAILGLSGAALQGLLRNPLAAPDLFGAPQSAAFGAVLVIALGLADVRSWALPVAAIMAAFASVFALLAIAGRNAGLLILILAGLAISSLAGAATALVMNLSSNPFVVLEIA